MIERGTDDRGVSELLGYVLVFSLVTVAATGVFVVGSEYLEGTRDAEQVRNAEKAFEVLAGNVDDHVAESATGRSTEIRVSDANLYVQEEERILVNISHEEMSEPYFDGWTNDPITYESSDGRSVVYSNGAVFQERDNASRMVEEPNVVIGENKTVIPILITDGEDEFSPTGSDVVQVRTERRSPDFVAETEHEDYNVTITIQTTPARAISWETYLDDLDPDTDDCKVDEPDTVVCEFRSDEVYVTAVPVVVELN